jgi:glycine dehydrogenase subunit 2
MLAFEKSHAGRHARSQSIDVDTGHNQIPATLTRKTAAVMPELSELEVVRHYTALSQKNFSIDTHFYPLGSCTMKYNPRAAHQAAMLPGFLNLHPLTDEDLTPGYLACIYELQNILCAATGMSAISLAPMAGAQGEFAGVAMIKAYHTKNEDMARTEMIVPDAAHGTNPASAVMCGYTVRELPTSPSGDIDLNALKDMLGPQTAGIMLTNPSTLGVFERQITEVSRLVHEAGGLLYYDGANLNAILGHVRPGDMGFDVMHLNLHKTFATPHGGGGPGAGPVACNDTLKEFLPIPIVAKEGNGFYWQDADERPLTIGRLSTFMGNTGVLIRAYAYARMLGRDGMKRVGEFATLNANYLMKRLSDAGFTLAYPERRASHEFIITLKPLTDKTGVTALDFVKRLLDYGIHAPTIYFPLLVPECLLIEPTETESLQMLDHFINVMRTILAEALEDPALLKSAPRTLPIHRLDEVAAARNLDTVWVKSMSEKKEPCTA